MLTPNIYFTALRRIALYCTCKCRLCPYSTIGGALDGVSLYSTSLNCLIRHCAVFVALRACYTTFGRLACPLPGKDGTRPYNTLYRRFCRLPGQGTARDGAWSHLLQRCD